MPWPFWAFGTMQASFSRRFYDTDTQSYALCVFFLFEAANRSGKLVTIKKPYFSFLFEYKLLNNHNTKKTQLILAKYEI